MPYSVSVVICTLDRAFWLETILSALCRQNFTPFEVIVVNGPSTDHTQDVLAAWAETIRIGRCPQANISMARNVGIGMAEGDFVAFLDDDAIPDEGWIEDLICAFDSLEVAAAGGTVYDVSHGRLFTVCTANRLGEPRWDLPATPACYPGAPQIPYVSGGDSMFRRDVLIRIGGFDPEYEYYLDEVDVCARLVDAGYRIKHVPKAFVYHASAPGHVRNASGVTTKWYSILKNRLYFSLKHSAPGTSWRNIVQSFEAFAAYLPLVLQSQIQQGLVSENELVELRHDIEAARNDGIRAGFRTRRPGSLMPLPGGRGTAEFKAFPVVLGAGPKLNICLLSQYYVPEASGGIPRRTFELACGLAALGHSVHVLTKSMGGPETISFENNVWVHRLEDKPDDSPLPEGPKLEVGLWRRSRSLLEEIRAIHRRRPVDIVEGSVWDFEGLATVLSGEFCTVTTLETPLKMSSPEWFTPTPESQSYFDSIVNGEMLVTTRATAICAVSAAVLDTMKSLYDIRFDPERVYVIPNGIEDRYREDIAPRRKDPGRIEVLFVGRFEARKGIDVLLQVIPRLADRFPLARFTLAGCDSPRGRVLTEEFCARYPILTACKQVVFPGKVGDRQLDELLAACDIFVGPSLYESFGLVYLEAMMFSKPVVACRTGGVPEVVEDGVTGLLAAPGDPETLYDCLAALIEDPALRAQYGAAGRQRFLAHFTREKVAARTLECYRRVLQSWKGVPVECGT